MKLFISWSGERSQVLGQGLRDWIPLVLHNVVPWLSEADIEAGERWAEAIAKELEASNFGIICITKENVTSPWVLFESGALAKSLQGNKVIPLLLDLEVRDITGPLAQFQAKKVDKSGVIEIIQSINAVEKSVPEAQAKKLFEALWPEFEKHVQSIPKTATVAKHSRPQTEILEELVTSIRSLDSRFREVSEESPRMLRHRRFRFHPKMLHELMHMIGERRGDPIGILFLASQFREDMPWLYELGMEAYRAACSGIPEEAERALHRFRRASKVLMMGPFFPDEMGFDPKMFDMMMMELDHLLHEPEKESEPPAKPKRKKDGKEE
jgi:hypothetical protein